MISGYQLLRDLNHVEMHQLGNHFLLFIKSTNNCSYFYRFFTRKTSQIRFTLSTSHISSTIGGSSKKLVAYIFHPHEPFIISIQKVESDYVVNFHFRSL